LPRWKVAKVVIAFSVCALFVDTGRTGIACWPIIVNYPHYWQIACGTLVFMLGSAGSMLTENWRQRKSLRWVRVLFVPVMLAIGALLTTRGWNSWNQYDRDQTLILAIAKEWKVNDARIEYVSLYRDAVRACDYKLMTKFPALATDDIRSAMTFKRFVAERSDPFEKTLFRYTHAAEILNAHFPIINSTQSSLLPFSSNEGNKTIFEDVFKKGGIYDAFVREHQVLRGLMRLDYPWVFEKLMSIDTSREFVWWNRNLPANVQKYINIQEAKRKKGP
jgi:hypothetical protein